MYYLIKFDGVFGCEPVYSVASCRTTYKPGDQMKGVGFAGQKRYCIREITKEEFQLANKVGTVKAGLVESY